MGLGMPICLKDDQMKGLQERFEQETQDRRTDLAAYCECISAALLDTAKSLREGKPPVYSLARLKLYTLSLPRLIGTCAPPLLSADIALNLTFWSGTAEELLAAYQEFEDFDFASE